MKTEKTTLRFMDGMKKNYYIIKEAVGFKGKVSIMAYFLQYPIIKIGQTYGGKSKAKLPYDVTLRNGDGSFYCGKNISYLGVGVSNFESKIREHFNIKKGVFVDIGSHMGRYTIMLGNRMNGKIISIEPNKMNFKYLKKNIKLNGLGNVIPLKLICSDKEGMMKLNLRGGSFSYGHSIKKDYGQGYERVESMRLDTILSNLGIEKVDFIKIDVEDAEFEVLNGSRRTLRKDKPKIIFESNVPMELKRIVALLKSYSYKTQRLDEQNFMATPMCRKNK